MLNITPSRATDWKILRAGIVVTLVSILTLLNPGPAMASGRIYPSGCTQNAIGAVWTNFCWIGIDGARFTNKAIYVNAAMTIVDSSPAVSGVYTYNCIFDQTLVNGVKQWQTAYNVQGGADGIVGNHTWISFYSQLSYSGIDDPYGHYYNIFLNGLAFYYQLYLSPD
jgi:hypothetical protein